MAEPMQAAQAVEPLPSGSGPGRSRAVVSDVARGYEASEHAMADSSRSRPPRRDSSEGTAAESRMTAEQADLRGRSTSKPAKVRGAGLTEGDADLEEIPKNNLAIVMPAIAMVLFLSALDQTIVATALPTIAGELNASPAEFQWVGTAYTLAMTVMTPFLGRVSDIIGRKPMLYGAIMFFLVFSALCGAAKNMTWLIVARAFQGVGGGSIIGLSNIVTSDITPLHSRAMYQGWIGASWGVAAVVGPILGGVFTTKASWRWCFYINLPLGGLAIVLLFFSLKLKHTKPGSFREMSKSFDFLGLFLLVAGAALLIVGFANAADYGFDEAMAYGVIIAGVVMMGFAIVNMLFTKRNAIIPARMFKIRTTLFFLIASLLHATAFIPANFLLPQLFQGVEGANALTSGLMLIPFAFCVAWSTVIAGQVNSRLRIVRPVVWVGYGLAAIGFGLFYGLYTYPIPLATQEGVMVVAGVGVGLSLASPLLILQAAMPLKEMASATSAWQLTRSLGGSIGLAIFTAVLNTGLRTRFSEIPGYGTVFDVPTSTEGYEKLQQLPEGAVKEAVLSAFADALKRCWIIGCAMFIACIVITLPTKSYSLNRVRGRGPGATADDQADSGAQAEEGDAGLGVRDDEKILTGGERSGETDPDLRARPHSGAETPYSEKTMAVGRSLSGSDKP